jgi:alpha-ketoglutarate-dependent 2,4-dichlorophenoxyacetate dioxygenase
MDVVPLGPGFAAELRPWPAHEARLMIRTTISATEADGVDTMRLASSQAAE